MSHALKNKNKKTSQYRCERKRFHSLQHLREHAQQAKGRAKFYAGVRLFYKPAECQEVEMPYDDAVTSAPKGERFAHWLTALKWDGFLTNAGGFLTDEELKADDWAACAARELKNETGVELSADRLGEPTDFTSVGKTFGVSFTVITNDYDEFNKWVFPREAFTSYGDKVFGIISIPIWGEPPTRCHQSVFSFLSKNLGEASAMIEISNLLLYGIIQDEDLPCILNEHSSESARRKVDRVVNKSLPLAK